MEGKSYDDILRHLGLWTLEERRNRMIWLNYSRSLSGYLVLELMSCLCWMKTRKLGLLFETLSKLDDNIEYYTGYWGSSHDVKRSVQQRARSVWCWLVNNWSIDRWIDRSTQWLTHWSHTNPTANQQQIHVGSIAMVTTSATSDCLTALHSVSRRRYDDR